MPPRLSIPSADDRDPIQIITGIVLVLALILAAVACHAMAAKGVP